MLPAQSIDEVSVRFEGFTVDLRRHGLYRGSERIHLTPTPFKALEFLARQPGSIVSKEQVSECRMGWPTG